MHNITSFIFFMQQGQKTQERQNHVSNNEEEELGGFFKKAFQQNFSNERHDALRRKFQNVIPKISDYYNIK